MSSQSVAHPARPPRVTRPAGRGVLAWLRNSPIRRKLTMLLLIPLATVVALTGLRLSDKYHQAAGATELQNLVRLASAAATLADDLQDERIDAIRYLRRDGVDRHHLAADFHATDTHADRYRRLRDDLDDAPSGVSGTLHTIDAELRTLTGLRKQVRSRRSPDAAVALRYQVIISDLGTYRSEVSQHAGSSGTGNGIQAAALFSQAKSAVSYEQALAYLGLSTGHFDTDERENFQAQVHAQEQSLLAFLRTATPAQRRLITETVSGDAVHLADRLVSRLSVDDDTNVDPDDARRELGAEVDLMRWAERKLDARVATRVVDYRTGVVHSAFTESALVMAAILLAVLVTMLLTRIMSRSLRHLGNAADMVAYTELPQAVERLRTTEHTDPDRLRSLVADAYNPIPVTSTDEVGRVARSFNGVHQEAIHIATEQAVQRLTTSAKFVGLARRSQRLVDKMIARLDDVERNEEDPRRVAELFELDHLATQMRRNDENLLILASADTGTPRQEDAALADVLAAARSEIARYERTSIGTLNVDGSPDESVWITAPAVNDVVRIFAELLENAAYASPPTDLVRVTARRIDDQVLVEIVDAGIGMTEDRRRQLNERLSGPEPAGLADLESGGLDSVRMMGLAVVALLAHRHGIRVHLGAGRERGIVVHVRLPAQLVDAGARRLPAPTPDPAGPTLGAPPPMPAPSGGTPLTRRPAPQPTVAPPSTTRRTPTPVPAGRGGQSGDAPPSAWFTSSTARVVDPATGTETPVRPDESAPPASTDAPAGAGWAADPQSGWRAAAAAHATPVTEHTDGGLPRRQPMQRLVPGSFREPSATVPRTAHAIRDTLDGYQRGVTHGRGRADTDDPIRQPNDTVES